MYIHVLENICQVLTALPGLLRVVILGAITAGPSPPPVVAETVMSDTSVLGVRLGIEKLVLLVVCSN